MAARPPQHNCRSVRRFVTRKAGVAGFRARGLGPGDKLLVVGASGGTGIAACQIARSVGAEVFAICSAKNVDFVVEKLAVNRARVFDYTMHREDQVAK